MGGWRKGRWMDGWRKGVMERSDGWREERSDWMEEGGKEL